MGFLPELDDNGYLKKTRAVEFKRPKKTKFKRRQKKKKHEPKSRYRQYLDYINSKRWARRRRRYYATHPNKCAVCGDQNVHLHHLTYERLGNELDDDLIPLCEDHHGAFHEMMGGSRKIMLQETKMFIKMAREEIEVSQKMRNL